MTTRMSLRSAPQRNVQTNVSFYNSRPAHPPITPAAYNPSGVPYAGAFYMGR